MSYKVVLEAARHYRQNPTLAEMTFWKKVRLKRMHGLKFYRQYIVQHSDVLGIKSFFIADFYCHLNRTIIEIDGSVHEQDEQMNYDLIREGVLYELGFNIIRFTNYDVLNHWAKVERKLSDHFLSDTVRSSKNIL